MENLLACADVKIGGSRPWDVQVHDERLFARVVSRGSLSLGEAYMDGWWDSPALDQFFYKIISARLEEKFRFTRASAWLFLKALFFNLQGPRRAFANSKHHYDIGNDLYQAMLDKRLTYTCGYWKSAKNLDEAQEAKLDLVCRKIGLKKGETVLDIGCGWGSFARYAARTYGAKVTGVTVSKEQVALGRELCRDLPVDIQLRDYRDVKEKFDHVVSLGMFEHVGVKNYRTYMRAAADCLKDNGLFLLHTIGFNKSVYSADPWIQKHIFPGGMLPSVAQIGRATEGLFVMEDWHNFGSDYDKTLMAWFKNFNAHWSALQSKYSERFYRMWKYYLLSCAGLFRARHVQLWQIVLSKHGIPEGCARVR